VRRLDEQRGLIVLADVSGKGLAAAVNTAFVKYTIRALALDDDDPGRILARFNRSFLQTITDPEMFAVVFVGVIDTVGLSLHYASAGHSTAYLRRDGAVEQLAVTGSIIGLDAGEEFATARLALRRGDTLVVATDGLTEARGRDGALLADDGAMQLVRRGAEDPQRLADEVVEAVARMSGGRLIDDLALLAIQLDGRSEVRGESAAA
jgi:sigma-B regulation protein RsbU (phosphoserine phosphatase)